MKNHLKKVKNPSKIPFQYQRQKKKVIFSPTFWATDFYGFVFFGISTDFFLK